MKQLLAIVAVAVAAAAAYAGFLLPSIIRVAARVDSSSTLGAPRTVVSAFETALDGGSCEAQGLRKFFHSVMTGSDRTFLPARKTFLRRIIDEATATAITLRYSDQELLRAYMDEMYLGRLGSQEIIGLRQGSRVFFGKPAADLTLSEGPLLAAIHRSPHALSPLVYPQRAVRRRNALLKRMLECHAISRNDYERSVSAPIRK